MPQTFTDPASGRPYIIDPATGQSTWADHPPYLITPAPTPSQPKPGPKRWLIPTGTAVLGLIIGASAGGGSTTASGSFPTATVTVTQAEKVEAAATPTITVTATPVAQPANTTAVPRSATTSSKPATGKTIRMPALVGRGLVVGFSSLQGMGVPTDKIVPVDVSGKTRMVLDSSNWHICEQQPAAGQSLKAGREALLGVVKWGEYCP